MSLSIALTRLYDRLVGKLLGPAARLTARSKGTDFGPARFDHRPPRLPDTLAFNRGSRQFRHEIMPQGRFVKHVPA